MITFKQFLQEATDARKARKEQNNHKNLLIRLAAVQAGGGSGIYGDTEEVQTGITDEWFDHEDTFVAFKPPKPINYEIAQTSGTTETLEGSVRHEAGHAIVTGPKGERYPIAPDKFKDLYDVDAQGTATPKKILKQVRPADHTGVLKTSFGGCLGCTC